MIPGLPWTDEENETLFEGMRRNLSCRQIAELIPSKSENAIRVRISKRPEIFPAGLIAQWRSRKRARLIENLNIANRVREEQKQKTSTKRRCLRCNAAFRSFGPGNRLCKPCRAYAENERSAFDI